MISYFSESYWIKKVCMIKCDLITPQYFWTKFAKIFISTLENCLIDFILFFAFFCFAFALFWLLFCFYTVSTGLPSPNKSGIPTLPPTGSGTASSPGWATRPTPTVRRKPSNVSTVSMAEGIVRLSQTNAARANWH